MKHVYVILVKSMTKIGDITRLFTRYPFSHVSISLDDDLERFYSFSRYYHNSPVISGFTSEYRSHLAAKKNTNLYCIIYKIPVSDEEYEKVKNKIISMRKDKELMYNYFSLLAMAIKKGVKVYKSYTCTSFVAETISLIDKIKLPKSPELFFPKDFEKLLGKQYLFFQGDLDIRRMFKNDRYYRKVPAVERISRSIYAIRESFHRLVFKKPSKKYDHNKIYINPRDFN